MRDQPFPFGTAVDLTYQANTAFTAPSGITVGGMTETLQWSQFLGLTQDTGPNGDTSSTVYDSYARLRRPPRRPGR